MSSIFSVRYPLRYGKCPSNGITPKNNRDFPEFKKMLLNVKNYYLMTFAVNHAT